MAHSLSAEKRIRQNEKRRSHNRWRKAQVKTAVKDLEQSIEAGNKDEAQAKLKAVYKVMDRVAAKGTLPKKAVARKKSRMAKAINKIAAKA